MLSGGRSHKTAISVLDYFHGKGKLFLVESLSGLRGNEHPDLDMELAERIRDIASDTDCTIITNAPLTLPPCHRCVKPRCYGKPQCPDPETVFMRDVNSRLSALKKNARDFSPYTQRAQELCIRELVPEVVPQHEAMGSNLAQISSRVLHLRKMLVEMKFRESYSKASLYRILGALDLPLYYHDRYKDDNAGARIRKRFLKVLDDEGLIFIYESDFENIVRNVNLFDALVLSYTGVLNYKGCCEDLPQLRDLGLDTFLLPKNNIKL